ncbi:hypothetical protein [Aurantibacter sp.]|uniref:hypothetical protein n=1 Tax=Aurantibacter sp. TaxID=2807103 RepID=UPI0032670CBF
MKATQSFYPYEIDRKVIMKKDKAELNNWTNDLEYINEELEYLLMIQEQFLNNSNLYQQLHSIRRENTLKLGSLYRYEGGIRNVMNDNAAYCDSFYFNNHEKNRNMYLEHLTKYRTIKSKVLSKIAVDAKDN